MSEWDFKTEHDPLPETEKEAKAEIKELWLKHRHWVNVGEHFGNPRKIRYRVEALLKAFPALKGA